MERVFTNILQFEFFASFIVLPLETHFPKGIELKTFQGEIRPIFPEILVSENLFTVVYGAMSMHIIMHYL